MTAEELRVWRARRAITQAQAGELLGITGASVSNYEKGTQPIPKAIELAIKHLDNQPA